MKRELREKLLFVSSDKLSNPFPYEEISKMKADFKNKGQDTPNMDNFHADLNFYCMAIAGSISYVLSNQAIPEYQQQLIQNSFFEKYCQYNLLRDQLLEYPILQREIESFEKARSILLQCVTYK